MRDTRDELVEDLGSGKVVVFECAVVLASQDADELFAGVEEAAPLTDGLESAVQLDGSGAVTVAEEAPVRGSRRRVCRGQGRPLWLGLHGGDGGEVLLGHYF